MIITIFVLSDSHTVYMQHKYANDATEGFTLSRASLAHACVSMWVRACTYGWGLF
jgi:hypothetical protein